VARVVFIGLAASYLVLYILKQMGIYMNYISDYAADLLCIPLALSVIHFALIKLGVIKKEFEFTPVMIAYCVLIFGLAFEWYLPMKSPNFTADPLDFVAYILGGVAYFIFRKLQREKQPA
jgi:hypothetical protein